MKVGLEIEYVVTVKQKKERKVEIFGYPKLIKKEILNVLHQIELKEELPKMCTRISNSGQFIRL